MCRSTSGDYQMVFDDSGCVWNKETCWEDVHLTRDGTVHKTKSLRATATGRSWSNAQCRAGEDRSKTRLREQEGLRGARLERTQESGTTGTVEMAVVGIS